MTGEPGVGKTTILKYVLRKYIESDLNANNKYDISVAGICLAHQAKKVLGAYIPNVFTFAKAYGMKEEYVEATGARRFVYDEKNKDPTIGTMDIPIFVHDEVSQYTPQMLEIVLNSTPMFSKIILVGDRAQLPPIDPDGIMEEDSDSPVFFMDLPEECTHNLTGRVRQTAGNKILELSDVIRAEIFGLRRLGVVLSYLNKPQMIDGHGFDFISFENYLSHLEQKEFMDCRLIAFRRKAINKHNPNVRNYLLNNPTSKLVDGDIVTMEDSFYKFNDMGDVDYILYNSETFRLTDVRTAVKKFERGGNEYSIETYFANIEGRQGDIFIAPTEVGEEQLKEALEEIAQMVYRKILHWGNFWSVKKAFCKYSYGYATTAYKAQGSTYDTVYVDLEDIMTTGPLTPKRKLQTIYTALTRARKDVWFLKS